MTSLSWIWRPLGIIPWLLLLIWFLAPTLGVIERMQRGDPPPPDLATYLRAANQLRQGQPLYATADEARQIWLAINALERANYLTDAGAAVAANIPGPYIYPPALAVWLYWLNFQPAICMGLIFLAIVSFAMLWVYSVSAQRGKHGPPPSAWWLLLVIGSWPVLSLITTTGNIEPVLLFVLLVTAWALWRGYAVFSAPLIAFVVLVKPFYALFYVSFGLLLLVNPTHYPRQVWRTLNVAALLTLLIIAVTAVMWGRALWAPAWQFLSNALEYHWLALPPAQQTPLSIWNRTPLQALVNLGIEPATAQQLALGLWVAALLLTLWLCWGRRLALPLTFALALVLLYWGRPIGWGFHFLEIVVLMAAWPALRIGQRLLLLSVTLALMASHWTALALTLQGVWLRLVTMQSAEWPWESWLVLPVAWLALVIAARQPEHPADRVISAEQATDPAPNDAIDWRRSHAPE